jgi:DNA-binding NtrC family response regulator/ligand-binding sensor domain-containing protein
LWVRPGRLAEFEGVYQKKLLPLLQPLGLVEADEPPRPGRLGVFSRLFALETPAQAAPKRALLHKSPQWQEALRSLSADFSTREVLPYHWGLYRTRAGPGRTVVAGPGFRRGQWHSFGVPDGLPSAVIVALCPDRRADLWICTWLGGACRFDGANFTTFTAADGLAHDVVRWVTEDRSGNLWFGTHEGASRYDGEEFHTFTTADGLAGDMIDTILEDRSGNLWFGTHEGASRYDGEEFRTFTTADGLVQNQANAIAEDQQGNLWFGGEDVHPSENRGVSRYDGEEFRTFTTADGLGANGVRVIIAGPEGELWFATDGGGVSRYDGTRFTSFTKKDGLSYDIVGTLLMDSAGRLWVGTHLGGVNCYDGRSFAVFTIQEGLTSNTVTGLAEDAAGHIWAGTWGGGLCRHDGHCFTTFTSRQGLASDGVTCLLEDRQGHLWCGTWEGVSRYDGEKFVNFTVADGLINDDTWAILEDRDGCLWFGTHLINTRSGLSRYDGKEFRNLTAEHGLSHLEVNSLLQDRDGHLWFGGDGMRRYDGVEFRNFTTADGLVHNSVYCLLQDRDGYLWIGTVGGLSRYDGERFANFTIADGLAHDYVHCLLQDRDGHLWFGTAGGLSRYDGKVFANFTTADGLAHDHVTSLLQDRDGYLWIGTWGGGLNRYDGKVFQRLDRQDGLAHDTVRHILQDRHGEIWIATEGGLTRYRPQPLPPAIHLTGLITDRRHGPIPQVELPVSQKRLVLEFQGRSWTTRPDRMAYVYRLQGHQDHWQVTYQQQVEYQDLPLGEYCFQVRAVDRDLNYSPEPAQVRVKVVPDPVIEAFTAALNPHTRGEEFVGTSAALYEVQKQLAQVVDAPLALLIRGETGTGKGLAARLVHRASPRQEEPFVTVSCGALPERLVESELFGHEKGAFTGAHTRKLGKVELAQGGTLFLDEIGDLPLEAQGKLLRLLEEYSFERVGGTETLCADVRVIAATNRNLEQMVAEDRFRQDFYFRLKVFEVQLPPLRQRQEDIPLLALYFMGRMAAHLHKQVSSFAPEALALLQGYHWPGNVRELQHVVERAVVVSAGPVVQAGDIALEVGKPTPLLTGEWVSMEEMERRYIEQVLEQTRGVIAGPRGACAILGLPESTLRYRIRKLGVKYPQPGER